jgi:hypothetical protein
MFESPGIVGGTEGEARGRFKFEGDGNKPRRGAIAER